MMSFIRETPLKAKSRFRLAKDPAAAGDLGVAHPAH
jgi:hypothetical protein